MTEETKQKLREAGREDLIKVHEINQSGYAGINPNGNIVDRREFPNAAPVQENRMLNIPKPKKLETFIEKHMARIKQKTVESKAKLAEIHAANFYDNWCEYTERDGEYLKRSSVIELLQEYGASVSVTLCGCCGYAHPYHEERCAAKVENK
jgi:hypothetical protein